MSEKTYMYEALAGDTWDAIALDFYNSEFCSEVLLEANPDYRYVLLFAGGEKLKIPLITVGAAESLPPWKRGE